MPSREQIEEAMGPMHPGNCFTREEEHLHFAKRQVVATLRLAIAAERIADALEHMLLVEVITVDDAPADPC